MQLRLTYDTGYFWLRCDAGLNYSQFGPFVTVEVRKSVHAFVNPRFELLLEARFLEKALGLRLGLQRPLTHLSVFDSLRVQYAAAVYNFNLLLARLDVLIAEVSDFNLLRRILSEFLSDH